MSALQKAIAIVLVVLLAATGYGLWSTRGVVTPVKAAAEPAPENAAPVIDQNTLLTAQRLARLANTPEEQPLAQAAVQTADHELDLAFSGALRRIEAHPPVLSPEAQAIQQRLDEAQKQLGTDTDAVNRLKARLAAAADPDKPAIQDQLELAQSQLEITQDQVEEANSDLLAAGGNVHQRLQKAQEEHAAAERASVLNVASAPSTPATLFARLNGLVGGIRQWLALHEKRSWLTEARHDAATSAARLAERRAQLVADLDNARARLAALPGTAHAAAAAAGAGAGPGTQPDTALSLTRQMATDQRRLTLRDQRISARHKLAEIYGKWDEVVATQQRIVLRDILAATGIVLVALLLLLFADRWLNGLLARAHIDRRQLETLRSVVGVALQVIGIIVILFVLVGVPGQIGTMLGIAGAGLTVALKDFIVAFIGWFVLMGKNGIRLGDWVEINGVSGEVVELGIFHTVLLETGNWTDAGHPTGRHVTFTNSFAIERHYFNFSTTGQWLWDELSVVVPFGRDALAVAAALQKEVQAATAANAKQAEEEWRRASRGQRGSALSAEPGIAVRPAAGGVEIAVRYVTRASERFALRARLSQVAVRLLQESAPA